MALELVGAQHAQVVHLVLAHPAVVQRPHEVEAQPNRDAVYHVRHRGAPPLAVRPLRLQPRPQLERDLDLPRLAPPPLVRRLERAR